MTQHLSVGQIGLVTLCEGESVGDNGQLVGVINMTQLSLQKGLCALPSACAVLLAFALETRILKNIWKAVP